MTLRMEGNRNEALYQELDDAIQKMLEHRCWMLSQISQKYINKSKEYDHTFKKLLKSISIS
jgi:metal-responsive CopG/Arc/MetJ family transcriptional regulator